MADVAAKPLSVYLHVPLCDRRCGFCDCQAMPLAHRADIRATFVRALQGEIDLWVDWVPALAGRSVTTVHWGGGTPLSLGQSDFALLCERLDRRLGISPATEIALESTSSDCTPENLGFLRTHGCSRLHVGVQTLEMSVRRRFGRREDSETVLLRLDEALERGFVVSVDLMYGLPGQSLTGLLDAVQRLIGIGVHGFSLYRLNLSRRNWPALSRIEGWRPDPLEDFVLLAATEQTLLGHAYSKNHFEHFARPADRNLYARHADRGEDLLALGPTADGVFSNLHYRHSGAGAYLRNCPVSGPALEGGLLLSPAQRKAAPTTAALMCGYVAESHVAHLPSRSLLKTWQAHGLLRSTGSDGTYSLTASGSWCVDFMIQDMQRLGGVEPLTSRFFDLEVAALPMCYPCE